MELGECDILKPSLQRVVTLIVVDEGFELPAGTIATSSATVEDADLRQRIT
jgi:hypothetical protein